MRYLIVKTSALGDIVQSFSVVDYLKKRFPEASIDWVVEKRFASLVHAHPHIDSVIPINTKEWKKRWWSFKTLKEFFFFIPLLRKKKYDAVFDLQGNIKSGVVTLFSRADARVGFGWKTAAERLNCCITQYRANPPKGQNIRRDYLFIVRDFFKDFSSTTTEGVNLTLSQEESKLLTDWEKKIPANAWLICPGSHWNNKKLSHESLISFLKLLHESYAPSFIFLSGTEQEYKEVQALAAYYPNAPIIDRLSMPLLQHIMSKMQLVISMDSFPLHLAGTTQVPTFSVFGPSTGFKYRPLGEKHFSYQGECPYGKTFEKRCPILRSCPTGACMHKMDIPALHSSFRLWWESTQDSKA